MSNLIINPYLFTKKQQQLHVYEEVFNRNVRQDGYTNESNSSGSLSYGVSPLQLGFNNSTSRKYNAYWWFEGVDVPPGATIVSAKFDNVERGGFTTPGRTVTWDWVGVKQANPLYPTSYQDYHSRPLTTATVEESRESPLIHGTRDYTANLASIFQEIIDQPGWALGNNVLIYALAKSGTYYWTWYSGNSEPRTLTIEYLA